MSSSRTLKTKTSRRYRYLVELQCKPADSSDWSGLVGWNVVRSMYANIRPRRGTLAVEGRQETEIVKYEITVPWNPDGFPAEDKRLVEGDRNFYVESVMDPEEDHREHMLICTLRDGS